MKKQSKQKLNLTAVGFATMAVVVIVQFVLLSLFYQGTRQMFMLQTTNESVMGSAVYAGQVAARFKQAVVSVEAKAVYLPDFHLKLPLSDLSTQLVYAMPLERTKGQKIINVTTFTDGTMNWADIDCVPLRISFDASPYPLNTHEHAQAPVALRDGRTLQIYAVQDPNCAARWRSTKLDPMQLAGLFDSAQSS